MVAFVIESWVWYSFAISMVVLRMLSRYLHFNSFKLLQVEDWFMVFIACLYTILIASLNVTSKTNSNLIDPHDIPNLTPQDITDRVFGSKMILVVEQCMCAVQWGTKACLLMLYWRLTQNLVQAYLVKAAAVYVATTYVVMEILYFGVWCRPFHDYWQTPTDNVQCTTALHHLILNLCFNLTSDLLIMSIPLPLLLRAHLEIKRKILLVIPFTFGFFSIICAILSKNLSFTQPFSGYWVYWYTREASTIIIVSNMPYTWGLAKRVFHLHSFFGSTPTNTRANSFAGVTTRDTAMEMVGGDLREVRGLPFDSEFGRIRTASRSEDGTGLTLTHSSKRERFFSVSSWKKSPERGMERLPSIAASPRERRHTLSDVENTPWTHINSRKGDALDFDSSGSSSAASDRRPTVSRGTTDLKRVATRSDADAINRLYRLDDDDLITDIEREKKRSIAQEGNGAKRQTLHHNATIESAIIENS